LLFLEGTIAMIMHWKIMWGIRREKLAGWYKWRTRQMPIKSKDNECHAFLFHTQYVIRLVPPMDFFSIHQKKCWETESDRDTWSPWAG
jgi:hypothetical protein